MRARTVGEYDAGQARNDARASAASSGLWPMYGPLPETPERVVLMRRFNRAGNAAAQYGAGAAMMRRGAAERGWNLAQCRGTLIPAGGAR